VKRTNIHASEECSDKLEKFSHLVNYFSPAAQIKLMPAEGTVCRFMHCERQCGRSS
jgi:hypothetical protein